MEKDYRVKRLARAQEEADQHRPAKENESGILVIESIVPAIANTVVTSLNIVTSLEN